MHLHFSASGKYQQSLCEPDNFHSLEFNDKLTAIMNHLKFFDEHRPFTSYKCREIIEYIRPDYITHELTGRDTEGTKEALLVQKEAISKK